MNQLQKVELRARLRHPLRPRSCRGGQARAYLAGRARGARAPEKAARLQALLRLIGALVLKRSAGSSASVVLRHPPRARRFPVERADGRCAFDWKPARSRRNGGVPAGAGPAARPVTAPPGQPEGAVCPNLPQRSRSRRSAGGESLIFRAFLRRRSRPGAPLQQIRTRPRPGPPQEPHPQHPAPAHPRHYDDPGP